MPTAENIHAALLFSGPDLVTFLQWRQQHAPNAAAGQTRYALVYYEYIHRDAQPPTHTNQSSKHIAHRCGHSIHPSDTRQKGNCPVCEIKISLEFLERTASAFGGAGGPWINAHGTRKRYGDLRQGWHMARLELENKLSVIRVAIKHEELWEGQHPVDAATANRSNTSAKALRLTVMQSRYPAIVSRTPAMMAQRGTKRKRVEGEIKTVSFAPLVTCRSDSQDQYTTNISFEPGRLLCEFDQPSNDYEPGTHAAPNEDGWEDTSHCIFGRDAANLHNMKVLVTDSAAAFKRLEDYPYACIGVYHGILGLHVACHVIFSYIRAWA